MGKPRKKLTREEKLAKDRLRKREKYAQIKENPELYSIQKEKEKRRYLARKEKNKICSIKDMTPRSQREQRRRWRKNSLKYLERKAEKKKLEMILMENSPPQSDSGEFENLRLTRPDLLVLAEPEKEKDILRKRSYETRKVYDSVEKRVDEALSDIQTEKKNEIKKELLFSETLSRNLEESYRTANKKEKRNFVNTIVKDDKTFRKYKLLHKLPFPRRQKTVANKSKNIMIDRIQAFFEEDANSKVAAGKREFINKTGEKKQKRYLNDNLKNLHGKFIKEQFKVSYSMFCKYRPFWVVFPKTDRDTCQCKIHSNVNYLIKALKNAKIITESTGSDVISSLCCDVKQKCLQRTCKLCLNKVLNYHEFHNDKKIIFYQWVVEKRPYTVKDKIQKIKIVSIKKKFEDYPRNIIYKLESTLDAFLKHNLNIIVQYDVIKQLKQNLNEKEILVHIDFSENYCLKYNQEIQSFHFGGSREQVSLHTGVVYYKDTDGETFKTKSFCTVSNCLQHDAKAIWAHLQPVLKMINSLVPYETVHFLSDSPSSQYRNRFIFYLITKFKDINQNISKVTWNYQESGHGKGAPDGIGAVVKRTADNFVKYGGDIGSFEDFWDLVTKNIPNVYFKMVTESDIKKIIFPPNIPRFKGTMEVHQIIWTADSIKTITLRRLSCFDCHDCRISCVHNKHLGFLCFDSCDEDKINLSVVQSDQNENTYANDNESILSIDTSTILNNIDDSDVLKNLQPLAGPIDLQLSPLVNVATSTIEVKSPKVKILSDVKLTWENRKFLNRKLKENLVPKSLTPAFNSEHKLQFESFINFNKTGKPNKDDNRYYEDSDDSEEFNIF
ncbi:unnamed protein product [Euphydryas editha]|uniref:Uncharacterized protein n=1 Tax=Euphydryas editha TaxID=104508 RepID=A0AAU9U699_EUPED|nr:unnamed protein product [Euphydryas editha]